MNNHEKWVAFTTILVKEIRRFMRIWLQTLVPPVITVGLYFVIFGNLIGSRIGEMDGFNYIEFVVPGLIMMSVITNSYSNVVSSFYGAKGTNSAPPLPFVKVAHICSVILQCKPHALHASGPPYRSEYVCFSMPASYNAPRCLYPWRIDR